MMTEKEERNRESVTSTTSTSGDGYITADESPATLTVTSEPWSTGLRTETSNYPASEESSPRHHSSIDFLASGESINSALMMELLNETKTTRGKIKIAFFIQRFFSLGTIVCVALLLSSDTKAQYDTALAILIALQALLGVVLFMLLHGVETATPWTHYQLSKCLVVSTVCLTTLCGATAVLAALPLISLLDHGLTYENNFYYVLIVLLSLLMITIQLYCLLRAYQIYKCLHVYKVAGILPQLRIRRTRSVPRVRHLTESNGNGDEPGTSRYRYQSVLPLELRYRYIIRREPLFFDLAHAPDIYGYFRKYLVYNYVLKLLGLAQLCVTSLLVKAQAVGNSSELASLVFSLFSGTILFITSTVPVFTYTGPGIKRELRRRAYLNGFKGILQSITACLSLYELIWADLNKNKSTHADGIEPYYLSVGVVSYVSIVLIIFQIDVSWTIQSMIASDLHSQYNRSGSTTSDRVSI